jgi:hypothetical protein
VVKFISSSSFNLYIYNLYLLFYINLLITNSKCIIYSFVIKLILNAILVANNTGFTPCISIYLASLIFCITASYFYNSSIVLVPPLYCLLLIINILSGVKSK